MADWDESYDLVIVGSGAGSIPAALAVARAGKTALILEKTDKLGGSTALSGGVMWIPDNPVMKQAGIATLTRTPAPTSTPASARSRLPPRTPAATPSSRPGPRRSP